MKATTLSALLLAPCLMLGQAAQADSDRDVHDPSTIGATIDEALTQAEQEIAAENLSIDGKSSRTTKAYITSKGELVINGHTSAATPEQTALLLDYRRQTIGVAQAGIDTGRQGARLAGKALAFAISSIFLPENKDREARFEREAAKIEASAERICARLPQLLASQQALATSMPEFKPYATMKPEDINDCHVEN